jgi:hypothetical protein
MGKVKKESVIPRPTIKMMSGGFKPGWVPANLRSHRRFEQRNLDGPRGRGTSYTIGGGSV